jgi:hypothetical protein
VSFNQKAIKSGAQSYRPLATDTLGGLVLNEALSHRRQARYRDQFTLKRGEDYRYHYRHDFAIAIPPVTRLVGKSGPQTRHSGSAAPKGASFSPVPGKFRRLFPSALPIYPGISQFSISGSKTSRHYLAGVPQSTLLAIENSSH